MGWWSKIRNRFTRWAKAITLGNTLEALWKGENIWKSFWKDQSIIFGEVFRLIDDFFPSYETFYDNQTVGLFEDPFRYNTLNSVVVGSSLTHKDLQDMLRECSLNSLTARANAYSKKSKKSELYQDFFAPSYAEFEDTDYTDELLSQALGIPLYEEGDENIDEIRLVPDTGVFTHADYTSIALDYLYRECNYTEGDFTYNNIKYKIIGATASSDRNSILLECIASSYFESSGSHTSYNTTKIPLPIKTYEGYYCKIPYLIVKKDTSLRTSEYWIAMEDPECPPKIYSYFKEKNVQGTQYLMPLRLRTGGKAIQQDDEEFKANEKIFKILGIDFVDIARCINADVSILTRRKYDDKNQQEKDVNYVANLEKVTSAFLFFGLELSEDHIYANEYFFKYFKWLERTNPTCKDEEIHYKEYGYKLTFDGITVTTEKCTAHDEYPEQYGKKVIEEESTTTKITTTPNSYGPPTNKYEVVKTKVKSLLLWRWIDENNIEKIVVTNLKSANYNGGWRTTSLEDGINAKSNDDNGNFYIPINMIPLRQVGSIKGSDVMKASIRVVYNSSTKIRKKWYGTTWFLVIRIVASIVIMVFSFGSATPYVLAANAAVNLALNIALQILISIAIQLAAKYICKIFHIPQEYLALVVVALTIAVSLGMSAFSSESASTTSTTTSVASSEQQAISYGAPYMQNVLSPATNSMDVFSMSTEVFSGAVTAWGSMNQKKFNDKQNRLLAYQNELKKDMEKLKELQDEIDNMRCKVSEELVKEGTNFTDLIITLDNSFTKVNDFDIQLAQIHNYATICLSTGRTLNRNSPILQASYFNV